MPQFDCEPAIAPGLRPDMVKRKATYGAERLQIERRGCPDAVRLPLFAIRSNLPLFANGRRSSYQCDSLLLMRPARLFPPFKPGLKSLQPLHTPKPARVGAIAVDRLTYLCHQRNSLGFGDVQRHLRKARTDLVLGHKRRCVEPQRFAPVGYVEPGYYASPTRSTVDWGKAGWSF